MLHISPATREPLVTCDGSCETRPTLRYECSARLQRLRCRSLMGVNFSELNHIVRSSDVHIETKWCARFPYRRNSQAQVPLQNSPECTSHFPMFLSYRQISFHRSDSGTIVKVDIIWRSKIDVSTEKQEDVMALVHRHRENNTGPSTDYKIKIMIKSRNWALLA